MNSATSRSLLKGVRGLNRHGVARLAPPVPQREGLPHRVPTKSAGLFPERGERGSPANGVAHMTRILIEWVLRHHPMLSLVAADTLHTTQCAAVARLNAQPVRSNGECHCSDCGGWVAALRTELPIAGNLKPFT